MEDTFDQYPCTIYSDKLTLFRVISVYQVSCQNRRRVITLPFKTATISLTTNIYFQVISIRSEEKEESKLSHGSVCVLNIQHQVLGVLGSIGWMSSGAIV